MSSHPKSKAVLVGVLAWAVGLGAIAIAWQAKGANPSHAALAQGSFASFVEVHANAHLDNLPVQ
jgi:hypothetical protein